MKNKILKQFLSLSLLTLACAFAFTGCSNKGNDNVQADVSQKTDDFTENEADAAGNPSVDSSLSLTKITL